VFLGVTAVDPPAAAVGDPANLLHVQVGHVPGAGATVDGDAEAGQFVGDPGRGPFLVPPPAPDGHGADTSHNANGP